MKYYILLWKSCKLLLPLLHFFIPCCPKNTWICQFDWVYRYIVYNEKTRFWPFYTHFAEGKKSYIELFCYNIVENHFYTKFGKKKKKKCFCLLLIIIIISHNVVYRWHSITYEWNINFFFFFYINLCSKQFKDMKKNRFLSLKKIIRP